MNPETVSKVEGYLQAIKDDNLDKVKGIESDTVVNLTASSIKCIARSVFCIIPNIEDDIKFLDFCVMMASRHGKLQIVKYLHAHGANIRIQDDFCFGWAAYANHPNVVKYLLDNGADINANDCEAFQMARSKGHTELLNLLLEYEKKPKLQKTNDLRIMDLFMNGNINVSLETYLETLKSLGIEFSYKHYRKEYLLKLGNADWIFITEKIYKVAPDDVLKCINEWSEEVADWDWVGTIVKETKEFEEKYPKIVIGCLRWKVRKLESKIKSACFIYQDGSYKLSYLPREEIADYIVRPGYPSAISNSAT